MTGRGLERVSSAQAFWIRPGGPQNSSQIYATEWGMSVREVLRLPSPLSQQTAILESINTETASFMPGTTHPGPVNSMNLHQSQERPLT